MQLIQRIRQSARLVTSLPPDLQRIARDSYSASLKTVFFFAACSTILAYLVRLPIPDKVLQSHPRGTVRDGESSSPQPRPSDDESEIIHDESHKGQNGRPAPRPRRLSTYEDGDAAMDPENGETRSSTSRRDC